MRVTMRVDGLAQVNQAFNRYVKRIHEVGSRDMRKVTMHLRNHSVALAPKDTGSLRDSGYSRVDSGMGPGPVVYAGPNRGKEQLIAPTDPTRGAIVGIVGFGEVYAFVQHEDLAFFHENGQAKYLETPFKANAQAYINMLETGVKGTKL